MGLTAITWEGYWLDDYYNRPGKMHAFPRMSYGGVGYRALCGYEPKPGARVMYHDTEYCGRCERIAEKQDDLRGRVF